MQNPTLHSWTGEKEETTANLAARRKRHPTKTKPPTIPYDVRPSLHNPHPDSEVHVLYDIRRTHPHVFVRKRNKSREEKPFSANTRLRESQQPSQTGSSYAFSRRKLFVTKKKTKNWEDEDTGMFFLRRKAGFLEHDGVALCERTCECESPPVRRMSLRWMWVLKQKGFCAVEKHAVFSKVGSGNNTA